jgi:hypothetical protein
MKKLRRITEAEVIADFLQGEFFHKEYDADRERFNRLVCQPALLDENENALRRALLFRRRNTMWWELPEDRQWWEIEFEPTDVDRVSVFPRAHWRKLARGNFSARNVAERVRRELESRGGDEFTRKMAAICSGAANRERKGLIIFLGLDETHPVTLLEGNHRFIASLLAPDRDLLAGARMVGVFSPQMEKCCWYKTNFRTLFRCLKNRIQHYWNRDPEVSQLLEQMGSSLGASGYGENTHAVQSKERLAG